MVHKTNLIKQHNARVLKNKEDTEKRLCNCTVKDNCPLNEKCFHENIVYQTNVITTMNVKNTSEN